MELADGKDRKLSGRNARRKPGMTTGLLASVTSVAEALIVLECGADIIDLKNPQEGALGALPLSTIQEIVHAIAGRKPVSATIGDLPMHPGQIASAVEKTAAAGVDIVKIGFFGQVGHPECIGAVAPLTAGGVKVVAVLFADIDPDFGLLPLLSQAGFHGVMLDTAAKNGIRLGDSLDEKSLRQFVDLSRSLGLLTGLAGSLSISDIPKLAEISPSYLGFRGALCRNSNRNNGLDRSHLAHAVEVLRKSNTSQQKTVEY
jgi:uncharacterized protein (UPF0264 family)